VVVIEQSQYNSGISPGNVGIYSLSTALLNSSQGMMFTAMGATCVLAVRRVTSLIQGAEIEIQPYPQRDASKAVKL